MPGRDSPELRQTCAAKPDDDPERVVRCTAGYRRVHVTAHFGRILHDGHGEPARADRSFHWIESSPAEQKFLGWELAELKQRRSSTSCFREDRPRAEETLLEARERGEALGLIVRVRTAAGKVRAVEVNVGIATRRFRLSATCAAISPTSATRSGRSASSDCERRI